MCVSVSVSECSVSMNQTATISHYINFYLYFHISTIKFKESSIKNWDISQFFAFKKYGKHNLPCVCAERILNASKIYIILQNV